MAITYKHLPNGGGVIFRLSIEKAMRDKQVNVINSVWLGNLDDDSTIFFVDSLAINDGILEIKLPWDDLPSYDTTLGFEFNEDEGYIENTSFYNFEIKTEWLDSSGWIYLTNLV